MIAVETLNRCDPQHSYASTVLNKLLSETEQKQRATDLVLGSIRNLYAIDTVIAEFSGRLVERIPGKLLNIIRIGTCELIYSPDTAQYSIVNDAVNNARALIGKKQAGFVNAVLRQITRGITNRQIELSKSNPARTLCQSPETGCEFDRDILPNPNHSKADYLSTVFSLPGWLVSDWLSSFGFELTRLICLASNRKPGIYIRPNSLKTSVQELAEKFRLADIEVDITPQDSMIRIKRPSTITQLPGFAEGLFAVQDITASRVIKILNPSLDWKILDLCAAPGVKTTQLAEITHDSAKIIATDIDAVRLKKVEENITRLGIKSIEVVPYQQLQNSKFDCILLDVPCSNTGVLARRVEARHRITPDAIAKLIKTQTDLLKTAASMLNPNGIICYSTCSIQKDENSGLLEHFLRNSHGFILSFEQLTLPSAENFDCDGGYTAVLSAK
ncbi:MAG: transcription antitermination factor NusB [Sedimentisphaerales bacterium]|nr:transcription antitermination factor NusB [Sedimentisphaerales bacterium]